MITITTATNSYKLNDQRYQKGDLSVSYQDDGTVIIGNYHANVSDITVDGQTFATVDLFDAYVADKLFKSGGGSGGGAVNSVTGNIVSGTASDVVVSINGTNRDIVTFDTNGNPISQPIAIQQLTDIAGFPSFANGVFTATAMNSSTKTGLLSFIEFSTTTPKANTFATYSTNGVLKVANAVTNEDAVNLSQLNTATTRTLVYSQLMPSGIPEPTTPYAGVLSYVTDGDDVKQVGLYSLGWNPVTGQAVLEDKHIPVYDSSGVLPVGNATDNNHAVALNQLTEYAGTIVVKPTAGSTSPIYDGMKGKFIVSYASTGAACNIDLQSSNLSDIAGLEVIIINKSTDSNINVRSFSGQTQIKSSASSAVSASVVVAFGTSKRFICDGVNLIGM